MVTQYWVSIILMSLWCSVEITILFKVFQWGGISMLLILYRLQWYPLMLLKQLYMYSTCYNNNRHTCTWPIIKRLLKQYKCYNTQGSGYRGKPQDSILWLCGYTSSIKELLTKYIYFVVTDGVHERLFLLYAFIYS